jgi:hypothetical protein
MGLDVVLYIPLNQEEERFIFLCLGFVLVNPHVDIYIFNRSIIVHRKQGECCWRLAFDRGKCCTLPSGVVRKIGMPFVRSWLIFVDIREPFGCLQMLLQTWACPFWFPQRDSLGPSPLLIIRSIRINDDICHRGMGNQYPISIHMPTCGNVLRR